MVVSPDADNRAQVTISDMVPGSRTTLTIDAKLSGDRFPAQEAVIRDSSGSAIFLGGHMPTNKNEVYTKLFGNSDRPITTLHMTVQVDNAGNFVRINSAELKDPSGNTICRLDAGLDQSGKPNIETWNQQAMNALTPPAL